MASNLQDLLITSAEISLIDDVPVLTALPDSIIRKLAQASTLLKSSHIIDKTKYDSVFVTSDIHADMLKLDNMLSVVGIVISSPKINPEDRLQSKIPTMEWIPERTLLVIVGDICDGKREHMSSIYDSKGNLELMLHCYLYNLRIRARAKNSELLFTIGNHDLHSVLLESLPSNPSSFDSFYEGYVHDTARAFYRSRKGRKACLMPFYNCCPYIMLDLGAEVGFVHGGFLGYNDRTNQLENKTNFLRPIQLALDTANNFSALTDQHYDFLSNSGETGVNGNEVSPLWSRAYTYYPENVVCANINPQFKMVVVGHCQMPFSCGDKGVYTHQIMDTAPYTKYKCGGANGCVVVGCDSGDGPKLAFVDIGFSRAFSSFIRPKITSLKAELDRRAEMLNLIHDPTKDTTDRYYNTIIRVNASDAKHSPGKGDELMWVAMSPEIKEIISEIKREILYKTYDYFLEPTFNSYDNRQYIQFVEKVLNVYFELKMKNSSIPTINKPGAKKEIFEYISGPYKHEMIGSPGSSSPTALHFIALSKNIGFLNKICNKMNINNAEYYLRKLPPVNQTTRTLYDRFSRLEPYANMGFLEILNIQLETEMDPRAYALIFSMKSLVITHLIKLTFDKKKDILIELLGFKRDEPMNLLHYAILLNEHELINALLDLNPPAVWLEAHLPSAKSPYIQKYTSLIPAEILNKTPLELFDIQIEKASTNASRRILTTGKARLVELLRNLLEQGWTRLSKEIKQYVNEMKTEIRYKSLEFIAGGNYNHTSPNSFTVFTIRLDREYAGIIGTDAIFKDKESREEVAEIIKKYIRVSLYDDTLAINSNKVPTPLHFCALNKDRDLLAHLLKIKTAPLDWYFKPLPAKNTDNLYDRFPELLPFEKKDFLGILNKNLETVTNADEIATIYGMKADFLSFVLKNDFPNKKNTMGELLEFQRPLPPTLLHYAAINKDHRLFNNIINLDPPITWLDTEIPKDGDPFFTKFGRVVPRQYALMTARGIFDMHIENERDDTLRQALNIDKQRLLMLSAKPKIVRNIKGLFKPRLAYPENEPFITNTWRKTLGLAKKGGRSTRKKRRTRRN